MSKAERTYKGDNGSVSGERQVVPGQVALHWQCRSPQAAGRALTFSCLKKQSIFISRKVLLLDMRF